MLYCVVLSKKIRNLFVTSDEKGGKMDNIRKIAESKIWHHGHGKVELWDFLANRNPSAREEAIRFLLGDIVKARLLLSNPQGDLRRGLPLEVLEFIRFGGPMMSSRETSLRFQPHLAFWSASEEERRQQIKEYQTTVMTFALTIPGFVLEDILRVGKGLSFYIPDFFIEENFWEPSASLTMHFVLQDESHRQSRTFQKLLRLGWPPERARLFLGANFYRKVWIQGDSFAFEQLFKEAFLFSQTLKVVRLMNHLKKRRQTQPSLFDEIAIR